MASPDLVPLCRADEVAPGSAKRVELGKRRLAVFNLAGRFYVTQDDCTHGPGTLSEGIVDGEEVQCDFHGGRFHIASGRAVGPPCTESLLTWEAQLIDGAVCIDLGAVRLPAS